MIPHTNIPITPLQPVPHSSFLSLFSSITIHHSQFTIHHSPFTIHTSFLITTNSSCCLGIPNLGSLGNGCFSPVRLKPLRSYQAINSSRTEITVMVMALQPCCCAYSSEAFRSCLPIPEACFSGDTVSIPKYIS